MEREKINEQLGRYIEKLLDSRNGIANRLKLEVDNFMFEEMNAQMERASSLQAVSSSIPRDELLTETRKIIFGYLI